MMTPAGFGGARGSTHSGWPSSVRVLWSCASGRCKPARTRRTSRICAPRPEFSVPVRQTRRPNCRAAFV